MFNFTTQSILNTVDKWEGTGSTKGKNLIINKSNKRYPQVRIGNARFNWPCVLDIHKASYVPENLAEVTFDLSKILSSNLVAEADIVGTYRIALYIGLSMNSQDSFYANDFVYKGKPFYVEFVVKNKEELTNGTLPARIKKLAEQYLIFQADEKILTVETNSTEGHTNEITFKATNGYQVIKKAYLQHFDEKAIQIDCCTTGAEFINLIEGIPAVYTLDEHGVVTLGNTPKHMNGDGDPIGYTDTEVPIKPGTEEFLGYNWIIHNLRLPTGANTQWWSPVPGEMPVVGGKYNQYIIRIIKDRDGIAGGILGQRATTVTTHVFYVMVGKPSDDFEGAIASLGTKINGADIVTNAPYAALPNDGTDNDKVYSPAFKNNENPRDPEPMYDVVGSKGSNESGEGGGNQNP